MTDSLREGCAKLVAKWLAERAHTYASENADMYRGFDNGRSACALELETLLKETRPEDGSEAHK